MKKTTGSEYDIFISYRRDGGESTAKILRDKLTELGYSVFFDVESLRSGDFNKKLYEVIEGCRDFILVLSPGALDRCVNEDDWVRLEIEHALEKEKNVIPVMLRGFTFPDKLPDSINDIRYKNGVESNYQFFDAFIDKLRGFLNSGPSKGRLSKGRRRWIGILALSAAVLLGAAFLIKNRYFPDLYPTTDEERNLVGDLTYYAQTNLSILDSAAGYMDEAYGECEDYLGSFDTASEDAVFAGLERARILIRGLEPEKAAMSDGLRSGIMGSPFSAADAEAMYDYVQEFCDGAIDDLYYMEYVMDRDTYMDLSVRQEILESYRSIMEDELLIMAYCTNQMFLPVEDEEAIKAFKYDYLPLLYYIPLRASDWIDSREALESAQESCWNSIDKSMEKIQLNIGEGNMEAMKLKAELEDTYMYDGMSAEEAERAVGELSGQSSLIFQKEAELSGMEAELEDMLAEARIRFAPKEDDDPDLLWGKTLRFLNLELYDDAIACVELAGEKAAAADGYAEEYTEAMVSFIRNIPETGIDYGLMVVGHDPEVNDLGVYHIGDVIISINGEACRSYEEYAALKDAQTSEEGYMVTVLRRSVDGLKETELHIDTDAPRVMLREVSEKY